MRHRVLLYVAAACVAVLAAQPVHAGQISRITWEVTGGNLDFRPFGANHTVTGGSLTYTPASPLMTPCSAGDCAGSGSPRPHADESG